MIVIPIKEGENIERALKKFKRKFEKTGVVKGTQKPSGIYQAFRHQKTGEASCRLHPENAAGRRIEHWCLYRDSRNLILKGIFPAYVV